MHIVGHLMSWLKYLSVMRSGRKFLTFFVMLEILYLHRGAVSFIQRVIKRFPGHAQLSVEPY